MKPCLHPETELVTLLTGEDVARVCTTCLARLAVEHGCADCEWQEVHIAEHLEPVAVLLTRRCVKHC